MMEKILFCTVAAMAIAGCHESFEDKAARECREYTEKYCPAPVSETVVTDSMVYERDTRTVHYYYALRGAADTTLIDASKARGELLEGVRNAPSLKAYKEAGFSFRYTYFSTKHPEQKLFDVTITPADYKD